MEELKILVIRFSSIGDIVLTSPVLRLLNSSKNSKDSSFLSQLLPLYKKDSQSKIEHKEDNKLSKKEGPSE